MQRMTGLLIGAVFGAVFVFVNAHSPLSSALGIVLRVLAGVALAAVIFMWFRAAKPANRNTDDVAAQGDVPSAAFFGVGYRWIVAGEVVLLFGGIAVMRLLGVPEQVNVAWIAFVVGVHFMALAPVWRQRSILLPGITLTVLGLAGFILAATSALTWVPIVSGVLSGVVLLAGSVTFAYQQSQ